MKKDDSTLTELAARLEQAIHQDVGMEGLKTLLHGWMRKGHLSYDTLRHRKKADGEAWLTPHEVLSFSRYAGYDLSKKNNP